ncbi:Protein PXR1 [Golovinomyces cichoracearum]|uniref:PinX1-related protein 1 n=1 Tax=Golovinomyces cichoracearum TaxID=62708 RepID=A0A420IEL6_9PEZI|nr:Protein PXR1 [Golovinomyces cichoracearum]
MGLAAPKKKNKLSHDPNNTRWTNNTQSFGRKILTSQGWKQGDYLGAKNAIHAEYHTVANSSHIRVTLKDDNLGLGAKIGSGVGHGECTGLDAFKNLLGRLNGKNNDQILKEQKTRDDIRKAVYNEKRWGNIHFVSAGYLVGDKIQDLIDAEAKRITTNTQKNEEITTMLEKNTCSSRSSPRECETQKLLTSKKRKADLLDETVTEISSLKSSKQKALKKSIEDTIKSELRSVTVTKTRKKQRNCEENSESSEKEKSKKNKKKKKIDQSGTKSKKTDKFSKTEKKTKREKRSSDIVSSKLSLQPCSEEVEATSSNNTNLLQRPTLMRGRHAIRSKNIAQKKLASMDLASLNQVSKEVCLH